MPIERALFSGVSWNVSWTAPGGTTSVALAPIASFNASQAGPGLPVLFDGSSSGESGGTIVQWIWDFGDGSALKSAISGTISHSYSRPGSYTTVLTVVDAAGKRAQTVRSISVVVDIRPVASFELEMTESTVLVDASASSDSDGQIASYQWDFGDGATASGVTVSHQYVFDGTYDITLIVTDNLGATTFSTQRVQAAGSPSAEFNFTTNGLVVSVDAYGSTDFNPISNYRWSWGIEGVPYSTGVTQKHTYQGAGTYSVTLTITDVVGRKASVTRDVAVATIFVPEPPLPRFKASVTNLRVAFDASKTTDVDSYITEYFWTFGDGVTGYGVTTSHTYNTGGQYNVTLRATDALNKISSVTNAVRVSTPPIPKPPEPPSGGGGSGSGGHGTYSIYNPWKSYHISGSWEDHMSYSAGGVDWPLSYGTGIHAPSSGTLHTSGGSGEYLCGWVGTAGRRSILYLDHDIPRIPGRSREQKEGSGAMHAIVFQHQSEMGRDRKHYNQGNICGVSGASADHDNYGAQIHLHVHGLNRSGVRVNILNFIR